MQHCSSSQALNSYKILKSRVYSSVICLYLNLFCPEGDHPPPTPHQGQELGFPESSAASVSTSGALALLGAWCLKCSRCLPDIH